MFQPQDYNYMQQGSGQYGMTPQGQTYSYQAHNQQQQGYNQGQMMNMAGNGGHGGFGGGKPKMDKPIKATEIKSYLHAWCTKRGEKPEYSYTSTGKPPKVRYQCQLKIASLGQEMTQEATSKKSAQTNVAWAYIDWLIQKGMVNPSELPPRPDAQNQNIAYNQQQATQAVATNDARYGGWTTENARQRLNRFCVQQGITCNIINQVGGTPQQKITTADLVLNVNGKELRAHAQSSNKKSANANCSLEMIAKLIEMSLIGTKADEQNTQKQNSQKRKVDDVDEHGNWNLTNSVQRMNEFASEMQNQEGFSNVLVANKDGDKFKGKCHTFCCGFEFLSEALGSTEDEVLSQVAFENISKLYKAGIILARKPEPRNAKRVKESGGSDERKRDHIRQTDHIMLPRWGSGRMTPWDDRHIKAKLVELEHSIEEKTALRDCAIYVEGLLKKASDDLEEKHNKKEHYVDIPENRILVGVMKVGDFAKGLLLKDEMNVDLCVSCRDKPTVEILNEVTELIRKHSNSSDEMVLSESDGINIESIPSQAAICITKNINGHQIQVNINFTSQRFNADLDGVEAEKVEDPPGMLPREYCIQNLIESRRTNFFTSTAPRLLNCICISRIVKDIVRRDSDWDCLRGWPMELTIVKSLGTIGMPETAGDCLRRFMSTIAGGTFLRGCGGLISVVEAGQRDLIANWTQQERESITFKAQTSLRLLSFRKIHQVLGIEVIPSPKRQSLVETKKENEQEQATE